MVEYDVPKYGLTQPLWYPDGTVIDAEQRRDHSMMPPEYVYKRGRDFKWDVYGVDTTTQRKVVNAFVTNYLAFERQGRGLYIYSETKGSGKTMLACCLCNEVIERYGVSAKFISVPDFVELVKDKRNGTREKMDSLYETRTLMKRNTPDRHRIRCLKQWM